MYFEIFRNNNIFNIEQPKIEHQGFGTGNYSIISLKKLFEIM